MLRYLLFLNFRFIFNLDRWVRQRFSTAGMLLLGGIIAAIVFGIDTRQTMAYQLFALLFIILIFAILSSFWFRATFTAFRESPRFVTVGETFQYRVQIQNHTPYLQTGLFACEEIATQLPTFQQFLDAKEPIKRNSFDEYVGYPRWVWLTSLSRGAQTDLHPLPPLPPHGKAYVTLALTPLRRGYLHLTSLRLLCPDPTGIFYALHRLPLANQLLALPKCYPVHTLPLPTTRKYQQHGIYLAMSVGDSEEFLGLREYRPGDPLRHIHWRSWAKTGKPVVREFQDEFFVRHALFLDTFTDRGNGQLFEAAVSVAASLVCAPRSHEVLINLMFVGAQAYNFISGRGLAPEEKLLEVLAVVQATNQPFKQIYPLIREHLTLLSGCVCVLLQWDDEREYLINLLRGYGITALAIVVITQPLTITLPKGVYAVRLTHLESDLKGLF